MRQGLKTRFQTSDKSWERGEALGLGQSWGDGGGAHCVPPLSSPRRLWTSQFSLQAPSICLPHICREKSKVLKREVDSGKGRKAKWATKGSSQTRPCLPGHQAPMPASLPSGGCPDKRGASYWVSAASSQDDSNWILSDYY
ncbi:unnamed protein product [Rangifer tarandus platyrhynchus]|uniref:Uncharacterized protein n=1 Tax=Rangifer tarandus platyrhynchus TaxID=3082113 RepID=A0AC59YVM8_RANTA